MNAESLKEAIKRELPRLLREDPAFRSYVLELTSSAYAPRGETQDRFNQLLEELRRDREEQARKWDESRQEFNRVHEEIMAQAKKYDRGIGALGARWGVQSEAVAVADLDSCSDSTT